LISITVNNLEAKASYVFRVTLSTKREYLVHL
jgi:hypothetical protein